jgi:hypothetical protein
MSRHRDPLPYFRSYAQLWKMLYKEVVKQTSVGMDTAKMQARALLVKMAADHPHATALVLFVTPDRSRWLVVPVGPAEEIQTVQDAQGRTFDGKVPVGQSRVG